MVSAKPLVIDQAGLDMAWSSYVSGEKPSAVMQSQETHLFNCYALLYCAQLMVLYACRVHATVTVDIIQTASTFHLI